jgi:hypothetical protein
MNIIKTIIMRKLILLSVLFLLTVPFISAQSTGDKNALGKWNFEAPYAPEGYTTGIIEFSLAEDKYSSSITFTGSSYIIPGEKTTIEKDAVEFIVFVEGNEVKINLKSENNDKMTGKAVYFEGEIPLTLIREKPEK